ncbi:MgtC/SapB family protein [Sphingomonas rubra]|uniref:Protein MgtC n=1 Tax=Sphingomonas rubra TaxID=634430 RepID=A0A1I5Q2N8_9SPHN|nr:MgtC/SapB family protein [Sphingomonas rubra]SFP40126.1 putative Mg2+ transporter-C (MgtC) family protein [Sphingomonas rubra]
MEIGTFAPVHLSWADALLRVGAAIMFAFAIGLERYLRRKPVDFRPFVIISLASCALTIGIVDLGYRTADANFSIDPAKVMSGVMTGIGFLGAGALFREKQVVQGAGSAAAIWASGAIGLICGLGSVWLGGLVAAAIVLLFFLGRPFTDRYDASVTPDDQE